MKWRAFLIVCSVVVLGCFGFGCKEGRTAKPSFEEAPATGELEGVAKEAETAIKSLDEYREEAEAQIGEENAEKELERLQKEIEADIAGEE